MATIFSKIVKGEIPSYKIAENDNCYAFLDINPIAKGHTLVIPKKEVDYFFDMDDNLYHELLDFTKEIAAALKKTYNCKKVGMAVIGLDVNHAHIHLVPLNSTADMDFSKVTMKFTDEQFQEIAAEIRANL
ncbi:MAG: HIT family protein [Bacteroidales bacterium]|jgi:histidine triad (HIT) family protein